MMVRNNRPFKPPCNIAAFLIALTVALPLHAEIPVSTLHTIYPPGSQPGAKFDLTIAGTAIDHVENLYCSHPEITFEKLSETSFKCLIGQDVKPGRYSVQSVGKRGVSSSRILIVSPLPVTNEEQNAESDNTVVNVELPVAVQGVIGTKGDIDRYTFTAQADQLVVVECWAERLDSTLRSNLEIYDQNMRKVQVEKSQFGMDTLLAFRAPTAGKYTVRLSDLVYDGSATSVYRLEIHSQPRVLYSIPAAITAGTSVSVEAFGYNLGGKAVSGTTLESRTAEVSADNIQRDFRVPVSADSSSATALTIPVVLLDSIHPVGITVTDSVVLASPQTNTDVTTSRPIEVPVDISGQLLSANDRHWYQVELRAGQTIYIDGFGQRLGFPVDLAVHVFSGDGTRQLTVLNDQPFNVGGVRFPTAHFDPLGEFTAPRDGTYHLVVRNRIGGTVFDPGRAYRLSITRQQPKLTVVAIGKRLASPTGFTVRLGGHETIHLLMTSGRPLKQSVRISASGLPPEITCDDVWIGPGIRQTPMTFYASETAKPWIGTIQLEASFEFGGEVITERVLAGTMVRTNTPNGTGRLDSGLTLAVADKAPLIATAAIARQRYQQGSIIDLNVTVDRLEGQPDAEGKLRGNCLPPELENQIATIPAGQSQGVVSFYIPEHLPPGKYSIAAEVQTKHSYPLDMTLGPAQEGATTIYTNAVTFEVYPAPFVLRIDLDAPKKIRRGEVIQMPYSCIRNNQFIGKIHTEIRAPGGVVGIRGRGVTFVGQTEKGVIQIIANDDAPLGKQPGLRLEGLGTVEDEGIHLGSAFLELEIVE